MGRTKITERILSENMICQRQMVCSLVKIHPTKVYYLKGAVIKKTLTFTKIELI